MPAPRWERLPAGPFRELIAALHGLYRAAGKPGVRAISTAIRDRDDLRDTVSHETVSAMLRGDGLPRWIKVECVVRQLADWAVADADPDREVRRFHRLWLAASDEPAPRTAGAARTDFVPPVPPADIARGPAPGPMISNRPPSTGLFVGRAHELTGIARRLADRPGAPLALHGLGGVGKTRLAVEYGHRWAADYDIVWWIPAERPSQAVGALAALGERLALPAAHDLRQSARGTLDALEASALRWLLVYDNATAPDGLTSLIPAGGGHTLVTTRNPAWSSVAEAVEIGVFSRAESVEFLRGRSTAGTPADIDELAERLADLPLALDQVSAMHATTGMPIAEYLRLFDGHLTELLDTGHRAPNFVTIAFTRLRGESPSAAQLLELLALMAPEPVALTLLASGRGVVAGPLERALHSPRSVERIARRAVRYGLARLDPDGRRLQVHRLVQRMIRESLGAEAVAATRRDVQRLLAAANPGQPDDAGTWGLHAEIGPHVLAADMVDAPDPAARQAVLDQVRYLERVGDFEASARLGEAAVRRWRRPPEHGGLGTDHELTVLATRHLANARRALGDYAESRNMIMQTFEQLRHSPNYGADHPHTLATATVVGFYLRMAGDYAAALALDEDLVARRRRLHGDRHRDTFQARSNLTLNLRLMGDSGRAHELDQELVRQTTQAFGPDDPQTLVALRDLARDLYDLGRYAEAIAVQESALPAISQRRWRRYDDFTMARRTIAIALSRLGRDGDAMEVAVANYQGCQDRFGPDHEYTLAAMMTYANILRRVGDAVGARSIAAAAYDRYRRIFGEHNPLTLAAATNHAIILRALGRRNEAHGIDEATLDAARRVLGPQHPYTLAAATGLATDLAHERDHAAAAALGERTFAAYRTMRTPGHPETWLCAANLALDLRATGRDPGPAGDATRRLEALCGPDHPDVASARRGERLECGVEPPPT